MNKVKIEYPALRRGVDWQVENGKINISYRRQGCILEPESDKDLNSAILLLKNLQEGIESNQYTDDEKNILYELDKLGLITQYPKNKTTKLHNGIGAYQESMLFINEYQLKNSHSVFYSLMKNNEITKDQLIGYVLEYLHITKMAYKILGIAMTHKDLVTEEKTLIKFFSEELYHDQLVEKSLASVGYLAKDLEYLNALPSTFGICTTLFTIAAQHILSFKVALFLFERQFTEFDDEFKRNSERLGLPAMFISPILKHAEINNNGNHHDISIDLLKNTEVVSSEDMLIIKQNLVKISQLMSWQDKEIVTYYSKDRDYLPRVFDE